MDTGKFVDGIVKYNFGRIYKHRKNYILAAHVKVGISCSYPFSTFSFSLLFLSNPTRNYETLWEGEENATAPFLTFFFFPEKNGNAGKTSKWAWARKSTSTKSEIICRTKSLCRKLSDLTLQSDRHTIRCCYASFSLTTDFFARSFVGTNTHTHVRTHISCSFPELAFKKKLWLALLLNPSNFFFFLSVFLFLDLSAEIRSPPASQLPS